MKVCFPVEENIMSMAHVIRSRRSAATGLTALSWAALAAVL